MKAETTLLQGSDDWFEMVGTLVCDTVSRAGLDPDLNWSLVERYSDGTTLPNGLVQGIRFDIQAGRASYRVGVRPDERGDVTIEVTSATARRLNSLYNADAPFGAALEAAFGSGSMQVEGDLTPLARAIAETHDQIVDRTS